MDKPYWIYETTDGRNNCISIRCSKKVNINDYHDFIHKFIKSYYPRILNMDKPSKLYDGSMVCIVRLKGLDLVNFENQGY